MPTAPTGNNMDLRKKKRMEEEEEKKETSRMQQLLEKQKQASYELEKEKQENAIANTAIVSNPMVKEKVSRDVAANPDLNPQQKEDTITQINSDIEQLEESAKRGQGTVDAKENKAAPSTAQQFKDALTFFAPQLLGAAVGSVMEGERGAVAGYQAAGKARDAYTSYKKDIATLDLQERKMEQDRQITQKQLVDLKLKAQSAETREKEFEQEQKRDLMRQQDRYDRFTERDLDRSIRSREAFSKRADVKKFKEALVIIDEMEDIVKGAPEIAVGTIPAKIARGLAGEVGVLTDNDIKRANISPSFMRNIKRMGAKFLSGKLPEEDVQELQKVLKVLREKKKSRFSKIATDFANARSKQFSKDIANTFKEDLLMEHGLEAAIEQNKEKAGMSARKQLDIIKRIKAKRGK
jgi:hypothetical protein